VHGDALWTQVALDLDAVRELILELKPKVIGPPADRVQVPLPG